MPIEAFVNQIILLGTSYAPKLILAGVTLFVGLRVIRMVTKGVQFALEKKQVDATLQSFFSNLVDWGLKLLLFISIASMVGIATTSFVAILGAAGLAIGLALQGTLANFAGGVLLLLFRPYGIGDKVEITGFTGTVVAMHLFTTTLRTDDNRTIIIPNGAISNSEIVNYSAEGVRRVEIPVGIGYDADLKQAKQVLQDMLVRGDIILSEPAPSVFVTELADSAVNLSVRGWCKADQYWDAYAYIIETAKEVLDEANISIPYPQREIHMVEKKQTY